LRQVRKERRELQALIDRDQFLQEWLAEIESSQADFANATFTNEELDEMAEHAGFRSHRAWKGAREDVHKLLHNFIHAEPFKKLWSRLKTHDREYGDIWGYSPGNAGVPSRLVEALKTWHQAPRFTATERREHSQKIAATCAELERLLAQLEPSHSLDGQYSRFRFEDRDQARAVFRSFGSPTDELEEESFFGLEWAASHRLLACGVTPLWAARNIRKMATEGAPSSNPLPPKVRAKSAKKTYFIGVVSEAIRSANPYGNDLRVGPQMIADIVELIADTDCTADDVRKAAPRSKPED